MTGRRTNPIGGDVNVIIASVPSRDAGLRAMDRLESAVTDGVISVDDVALVYKTDTGRVKIQQTGDATGGRGALKGGALGVLVGLFSAPLVPAVAVGAGLGALVGRARNRGISDRLIKQAGQAIQSAKAVVFVLADTASTIAIMLMIEDAIAEGATVEYEVLPAEAQDFLREAIELSSAA